MGGSDGESDGRYICERTTSCTRTAGNALKLMDDTERARALARTYIIHTYTCTMSVRVSLIDLGIVAVYIYIYIGVLLINLLRVTSPSYH